MTPPPTVRVGAHTFTIDATDTTTRLLTEDQKLADTRIESLLIRLRNDRPHTARAESLVHESLHAMFWDAGLQETPVDEHEELLVTALAPRLLALLRDNPDLVRYLTAA